MTFAELLYNNITPIETCNKFTTSSGKMHENIRKERIFRIKARLLEVFESKKGAICIRYIPYSIFSTNDGEIINKIRNKLYNINDPNPDVICINKKYNATNILKECEHKDLLRNIVNIQLIVKITKFKNKYYIDICKEPKIKIEGEDTFITDLDKYFNNCLHDNEKDNKDERRIINKIFILFFCKIISIFNNLLIYIYLYCFREIFINKYSIN